MEEPKHSRWKLWMAALAIGCVFVLPHVVRVAVLGGWSAYTPYTAASPSPMTWDETFLYAAETNYSFTRGGSPAYDDTWEHRRDVYPYSILPTEAEAAAAKAVGSLKGAHVLFAFLFPALSGLLLMILFRRCGASAGVAAALAMVVLVGAFSGRSVVLGDEAFLLHTHGARAVDSLQAGRSPNPNMTLPMLLGAVLCMAESLRRRGRNGWYWAADAGVLGGLLFYSYIYYAIAFAAGLGLLAAVSVVRKKECAGRVCGALGATVICAVPFLLWKHASDAGGTYLARSSRLGLEWGRAIHPEALRPTLLWLVVTLVCAAVWMSMRRRQETQWRAAESLMPMLLTVMAGGLVGLNMQVVTGFQVQAAHHFPHMVLQPVGLVMVCVLVAMVTRDRGGPRWAVPVVLAGIFGASAVAQIEAGRDSAEMHRERAGAAALYAWLNVHSAVGSVLATTDLRLSVELPARTHNSVLWANGSRSSAGDAELMERFLLAEKLVGASASDVSARLRQAVSEGTDVPVATPTYYMFETSATYVERGTRRVSEARMPEVMAMYAGMDVGAALGRYRVDYVWVETGGAPLAVSGLVWRPVFTEADGQLWALRRE